MAAVYAGLLGFRFIPGVAQHQNLFMVFAFVIWIAAMWLTGLGTGKTARLTLRENRIELGVHALERATLTAHLAIWKQSRSRSVEGSALCLQDGQRALCIGGRDRLTHARAGHLTVDRVDASLSADDFAAFLDALSVAEASPEVRGPIAIDLVPTLWTVAGVMTSLWPWFAAIAVAGALGLFASALHFERSPNALIALQVGTIALVLGGLGLSVLRQFKPRAPRYRLLVERRRVLLEDTKARPGRAPTIGPPIRAERHFYRSVSRSGSRYFATVRVIWPSGRSDVIGVQDSSWRWPGDASQLRKLHYVIGRAEWQELITALTLTQ